MVLFEKMSVQVSLARLGAGFGSALADIFQPESLRSPLHYGRRLRALRVKANVHWTFYPQGTKCALAERISQWGIDTRH